MTTPIPRRTLPAWLLPTVALLTLLVFGGVMVWLLDTAISRAFTPRYRYLVNTLQIESTAGCPGGFIPFSLDIDLQEPNSAFLIGENWVHRETGMIYDVPPIPRLVDEQGVVHQVVGANVPRDAPPGTYTYERGAITSRSDVLVLDLVVLPPDRCDGITPKEQP